MFPCLYQFNIQASFFFWLLFRLCFKRVISVLSPEEVPILRLNPILRWRFCFRSTFLNPYASKVISNIRSIRLFITFIYPFSFIYKNRTSLLTQIKEKISERGCLTLFKIQTYLDTSSWRREGPHSCQIPVCRHHPSLNLLWQREFGTKKCSVEVSLSSRYFSLLEP